MALDAVAAAENLTVTDEELEAEYQSMAGQYGMEVDQVKSAAPADDVKTTLLRRKALELVKAEAKAEKPQEAAGEEALKKKTTRSRKGTPAPDAAKAGQEEE